MSVSVIGSFSAYQGPTEAIRRPSPHASSSGRDAVRPVASVKRPQAEARGRDTSVIIEIRPDPPEEAGRKATRQTAESARRPIHPGNAETAARDSGAEFTYRANPDTPFRRRTSEQTYQAVETVDAPVSHRGGIFDLRI